MFKTVAVDLYQKADSRLEDTKRREEKKAERGTTGSGVERRGTAGGGEREVPEVVCNLMKGQNMYNSFYKSKRKLARENSSKYIG